MLPFLKEISGGVGWGGVGWGGVEWGGVGWGPRNPNVKFVDLLTHALGGKVLGQADG